MKKSLKLVLLGGGGHCRSVIDTLLINTIDRWDQVVILDPHLKPGTDILGIKVIGDDNLLRSLFAEGYHYAFITLANLNTALKRRTLYKQLKLIGFSIPNVIDPSAIISQNASLEEGIFVGKNAIVNAGSEVGVCSIVNSGSIVEHDALIGDFVHLAPGSVINGAVTILENTFIGSNSTVKNNIHIGRDTIVGMGSVVIDNLPDQVIAYGNPCRIIK